MSHTVTSTRLVSDSNIRPSGCTALCACETSAGSCTDTPQALVSRLGAEMELRSDESRVLDDNQLDCLLNYSLFQFWTCLSYILLDLKKVLSSALKCKNKQQERPKRVKVKQAVHQLIRSCQSTVLWPGGKDKNTLCLWTVRLLSCIKKASDVSPCLLFAFQSCTQTFLQSNHPKEKFLPCFNWSSHCGQECMRDRFSWKLLSYLSL